MTEDRLIELIEAWGADPSAFPEAERAAARAMLAAQPARFAAAIAEARALDAALAAFQDTCRSLRAAPFPVVGAPGVLGVQRAEGPETQVSELMSFHSLARPLFLTVGAKVASVQLSARGSWSSRRGSGFRSARAGRAR